VKLDLAKIPERQALFQEIAQKSKNVLAITEGVMPYLTNDQAGSLALDLAAQRNFNFWITDYLSREALRHMKSGKHRAQMKNAPFEFEPGDWFEFFKTRGWEVKDLKYLGEEGERLGRPLPIPLIFRVLLRFSGAERRTRTRRMSGYALLGRAL